MSDDLKDVVRNVLHRVDKHVAFTALIATLGGVSDTEDKLALAAALAHFVIASTGPENAEVFNTMLSAMLLVAVPSAATVVLLGTEPASKA